MSDKVWKGWNYITGQWEAFPKRNRNEPTEAWVRGWNEGMQYGKSIANPFTEATLEWHEWQDGWEAAMED